MIRGQLIAIVSLLLSVVCFGETRKALVIGITDYPKYDESLIRFAHKDALIFKNFLEADLAGRVDTKTLVNGTATREAIWDALDDLKRGTPSDTLMVFFSGHAELDSDTDQLYLMPSDGNKDRLSATGLPFNEFLARLRAIGNPHILLFLDACHTGAALGSKGMPSDSISETVASMIAGINQPASPSGVTVFVSAAKHELSWEDEDNNLGIFTRLLVRGLEGAADGPGDEHDGKITTGELSNYLSREVPDRARALGRPPQHPFVSTDFDSTFIISMVATSKSVAPQKMLRPAINLSNLRESNPELALMVYAGSTQANYPADRWTPEVNGLKDFFEADRALKIGMLPATVRPERLIGSVINSDGTMVVACIEPYSLISISLNTEAKVNIQPVTPPAGRRAVLDSCEISISSDSRYAVTRMRNIDGTQLLSLVGLRTGLPIFPVGDYEAGVFIQDLLLLSKGDRLTTFDAKEWTARDTVTFIQPIRSLTSNPDGAEVVVVFDQGSDLQKFVGETPAGRESVTVESKSCYPTGDVLYCIRGRGFATSSARVRDGSSGGFGCDAGGPRGFPSYSLKPGLMGWRMLFSCAAQPEVLRLMREIYRVAEIRLPEPILSARLLTDGRIIAVGQRGGVYHLDSVKYGDCCSLSSVSPNVTTLVAAGDNGITLTLQTDKAGGTVSIFRDYSLVREINGTDMQWVKQLLWSSSERVIALAGDSRLRLIDLRGNDYEPILTKDFGCGIPAALGDAGTAIACIDPKDGTIQIRTVSTGQIERVFEGHPGPVQHVFMRDSTLTAAGAFSGRSQTLVTLWNIPDGKIVSQSYCPIAGQEPEKPFAFLRDANYFVQRDTAGQLLARNSLTCEATPPFSTGGSLEYVEGASKGSIAVSSTSEAAFVYFNPWDLGFGLTWDLQFQIRGMSLSPDGSNVVVIVADRILRIPVSPNSFLRMVQQRIPREFSTAECNEFFPGAACPILKH